MKSLSKLKQKTQNKLRLIWRKAGILKDKKSETQTTMSVSLRMCKVCVWVCLCLCVCLCVWWERKMNISLSSSKKKKKKRRREGALLSGEVSDMDEGVVEGGEDVADSEHVLSFSYLRTQTDHLLLLLFLPFTRSHCLQHTHTHTAHIIIQSHTYIRLHSQTQHITVRLHYTSHTHRHTVRL